MKNFVIFPRITDIYPASQNRVGGFPALDRAPVGTAIHSRRHAADNVDSRIGKFPGIKSGRLLPIFRAGSGADNGNRRDLVFRKISLYEKRRRAVFIWKETFRIVCVSFSDKADPRPFQPIKFLQPCRFLLSCLQKDRHALLCENSRFLDFLFLCRPDLLICSEPFP